MSSTRWIGMDLHKKQVEVCAMSQAGAVAFRQQVACTREALLQFARQTLRPEDEVAVEATANTWAVVDLLTPFVARVVVSNPLQTKAIASAKVKTDRIDARVLADLLRCGYLPEVWQPDPATRRRRRLTHRRAGLVKGTTAIKNRLHAVLGERLMVAPVRDLFSPKGLTWLREVTLDEEGRERLDSDLRLLEATKAEIELLDQRLAAEAYPLKDVRLLMTLPGVGPSVALGVVAAWGDASRFADGNKAASYLGLVPSTRQSAQRCYHGPITKQGNSHARWLLIQAAQHLLRHPGPLGVFFRRITKKKGHNVAVVAGARKLAVIGWLMLKNREPYRYAVPLSTQTKLARLRVQATGQRRKSGPPAGGRRVASHGTGQRTRRVPSVSQVCVSEDLPVPRSLAELSAGEQRILGRTGTKDFVAKIQEEELISRRTSCE